MHTRDECRPIQVSFTQRAGAVLAAACAALAFLFVLPDQACAQDMAEWMRTQREQLNPERERALAERFRGPSWLPSGNLRPGWGV